LQQPHLFFSCKDHNIHVCPVLEKKIHHNDRFEPGVKKGCPLANTEAIEIINFEVGYEDIKIRREIKNYDLNFH